MALTYIIKGLQQKSEYNVKVSQQSKLKDITNTKFGCCFKILCMKPCAI